MPTTRSGNGLLAMPMPSPSSACSEQLNHFGFKGFADVFFRWGWRSELKLHQLKSNSLSKKRHLFVWNGEKTQPRCGTRQKPSLRCSDADRNAAFMRLAGKTS